MSFERTFGWAVLYAGFTPESRHPGGGLCHRTNDPGPGLTVINRNVE